MVVVNNRAGATRSQVVAGAHVTESDTTPPAGLGAGFRPHELLEAALASCMAITLRMIAEERGFALQAVTVSVEVDRSNLQASVFRTMIDFKGDLSGTEREVLESAARNCPVPKTLSRTLKFLELDAGPGRPSAHLAL